jgi:hypothetical protein
MFLIQACLHAKKCPRYIAMVENASETPTGFKTPY